MQIIKNDLRWILIIAAIALAVYANSISGEFVYDDVRQIGRNPLIQEPALAGKALTSDVWAFKGDGNTTASNYWRPTFTAWHIINFNLFGLRPAGWHITNILLHVAVCVLGFVMFRRWEFSPESAFAAALVFAVHPVHSESVAWISGSPDLLASLFFFGSLWFAEDRRENGRLLPMLLSIVMFTFALGAKEIAIMALPIFLIVAGRDGAATRCFTRPALTALIPYALVAVAYFGARLIVIGKFGHAVENAASVQSAFFSAPAVFLFYLKQLVFPLTISINYPMRPVEGFDLLGFLIPAMVAITIAIIIALLARRSFKIAIAAAIFLLPLAGAFNLAAFPADQIVHDRYLYLPLFGFAALIVAALESRLSSRAMIIGAIVIAVPFAVRTVVANRAWQSNLSLWENAARIDPQSASTMAQYGTALSTAGRFDEAITAFNASLDVEPTANAYLGRAQSLIGAGKFEEAVWDLRTVTEMENANLNAYTLFQSYEALAVALQRKNDLVGAERFLREARKRLPIYYAALTEKIAVVMYLKGNKTGALEELESARLRARTELLPTSKNVFVRLGMLYAEMGDRAKAKADLAEYLKRTDNATDPQILAERKAAAEMFKSLN